jgi:signal transduction histidine kinase
MTEPIRGVSDPVGLERRLTALEADHRRAFEQAQREADALFSQYQLSQLIATGGSPAELADAVLVELTRLAGAAGGAVWLGDAGSATLTRVAINGDLPADVPSHLEGAEAGRRLAASRADLEVIVLGDEPSAAVVALIVPDGAALDADGLRVAQLARHELAVAFAGARLRETLERQRQELGAIVDGATDLILQVDADLRVLRINPAGERMLGVDASSAAGRTCAELLGCDAAGDHGPGSCPLAEVMTTGAPIADRQGAVRSATGLPLPIAGSYSRSPAGPGGPVRATAMIRDVSASRALEQLRESFVATVSHELRTPVALVRGYAETILHLDLEAGQEREYVERILQVTARIASLVDQILDVTHLDADPLVLERRPVALADLLARLRGDQALSGQVDRLLVNLESDLPLVDIDATRIGQVLENLVGNALKYAPGDSPVLVGARVRGDAQRWVEVTVDDEGVGVPEDERTMILEPFHRARNVRESRIPGTGLGLYICRRLVEAHGGRLSLVDRPDGRAGTRAAFTLPAVGSEPAPSAADRAVAEHA